MENPRTYGNPPVKVVLVHGGPGAAGEMAAVAKEICLARGVLEPLQTACTVPGQVDELKSLIERYAQPQVILVGHSWGAWLSYILAARHPGLVRKLVLLSSGPFLDRYVPAIEATRLSRLGAAEREEIAALMAVIEGHTAGDREKAFRRVGALFIRTDAFDPPPGDEGEVVLDPNIFRSVWAQAAGMRTSQELLRLGARVGCPVVALHGDYDPHPAEGVKDPLSGVLKDFNFVLLGKCGHRPWIERHARHEFFRALEAELAPE
jgi:pimeloyl-ACP methyl ester carboxylesterase